MKTTHQGRSQFAALWVTGFVIATLLAGCGGSSPASHESKPAYESKSFVLPFEVTLPSFLQSDPIVDQGNFVTWESKDSAHAVRFLVPVNVYRPGDTDTTSPPRNYLEYLLIQKENGARFDDVKKIKVGGRPATIMTATTSDILDGGLGCPTQGLAASDCYGLQPDLELRIAVVDFGDQTLLVWLRSSRSEGATATQLKSFEDMLASIRFTKRSVPPPTESTSQVSTPIDGVWTANWTYDELAKSALLMDEEELNDENWGNATLTFQDGQFTSVVKNAKGTTSDSAALSVDGTTVTLTHDSGEKFVMRWSLKGDKLTFTRDESLGVGPTPFLIKPWMRQR